MRWFLFVRLECGGLVHGMGSRMIHFVDCWKGGWGVLGAGVWDEDTGEMMKNRMVCLRR